MGWESEIELPEFWGEQVEHQPRERATRCSRCQRADVWSTDALCDGCRERLALCSEDER